MDENQTPRLAAGLDIIELPDGMAVHYGDTIHTLNPTGAEILGMIDGTCTVRGIMRGLSERYPDVEIESVVRPFFDELLARGLVEV